MASNYCLNTEYKIALERRDAGDAIIVPVVVRDCDWDAKRLKTFNALPPDAAAVTRNAGSKSDAHQRDAAWVKVIDGLKPLIGELKKSLEPAKLNSAYLSALYTTTSTKHPLLSQFDERLIFVDPDLYLEKGNEQITTLPKTLEIVAKEKAIIFSGEDRSGKTLFAKMLQEKLIIDEQAAILINGKNLKNSDFSRVLLCAIEVQLDKIFPL